MEILVRRDGVVAQGQQLAWVLLVSSVAGLQVQVGEVVLQAAWAVELVVR